MKDIYCGCGELVARLEKGSLLKSGTTFKCKKCNTKNNTYDRVEDILNNKKRDNFNAFNDILKKSGVNFEDYI